MMQSTAPAPARVPVAPPPRPLVEEYAEIISDLRVICAPPAARVVPSPRPIS